jgi:hypothetical protein
MKLGFLGTIFVVLMTLKLTGVVAMSWWWVFSPIWLPIFIILVIIIGAILITGSAAAIIAWIKSQ